jgi:hypothetical protein
MFFGHGISTGICGRGEIESYLIIESEALGGQEFMKLSAMTYPPADYELYRQGKLYPPKSGL